MTIVSVDEMWSRKTSFKASEKGVTYNAGFTSAYQIVHSVDATEIEIINATGVPELGDQYENAPGIYCTNVSTQKVGPIYTIASVSWSGETGPGDVTDDPLNKEPEITRGNIPATEAVDEDDDGRPFTNVNGELVDGITTEVSDFFISVKRNYNSINMQILAPYLQSVNSDVFDLWAPGMVKFQSFSADEIRYKLGSYQQVTAKLIVRQPFNTIPARAWWKRYRNEGLYERGGTTVAFSSGGGSGASGYAIVSSGGAVTAVVVTNSGRDYSSAPTVTISSTSGGTGATGTASINSAGRVTSVSVGAGGTGYKSKLIRAVDQNKEPVTKPVLLAANGTREHNSESAVWIERPVKVVPLPYSVLGLL